MSQNLQPITPDCVLLKTLTSIPEKFIVDFANSIDVTRDHSEVQIERNKFFARCFDGFTGKDVRRQTEINTNLTNAVECSLTWLTELTQDLAHTNHAITRVNERVTKLTSQVTYLAQYSENTRLRLDELAQDLNDRMLCLDEEVMRIGFNQKVILHLDQVFNKWRAGRLVNYSPAGRCYAAIEELRWGAFGDFCLSHTGSERDSFMQQAVDRATAQLATDAEISTSTRLSFYSGWLQLPHNTNQDDDWHQALKYLANGFTTDKAPLITTITQKLPERLGDVPVLANASRIAETIVDEVFTENNYV